MYEEREREMNNACMMNDDCHLERIIFFILYSKSCWLEPYVWDMLLDKSLSLDQCVIQMEDTR